MEIPNRKNVDWMEKVSDQQYRLKKDYTMNNPLDFSRVARLLLLNN
jgi:hypothetical protein